MSFLFPSLPLLFVFVLWGGWLHYARAAEHVGFCRRLKFSTKIVGSSLQFHAIKKFNLSTNVGPSVHSACTHRCIMDPVCVSVNIGPPTGEKFICELSDSDHMKHPADLKKREGFLYIGTENPCFSNPCLHDSICLNGYTDKQYLCQCRAGYTGEQCEEDIDECAIKTDTCSVHEICNNTEGSFNCSCKDRLAGNNFIVFRAVFTNLNASGRYGPTTLGGHYTGKAHDGQVTLSSGIQQWTVPYTGDYRIEAVGAAGGYDTGNHSALYRGRGVSMIGTFSLCKGEIIQILVGQEGGINTELYGSGGGGGTFVVRGSITPLIIAGGGGGVDRVTSRHTGCDASTSTTGNPGFRSWSGGSNGHGSQTADGEYAGGGGGGFYSSGRSGMNFNGTIAIGGEGGKGFLQGGVGGRARRNNADGGFGGGAGAPGSGGAAGGGGGFSGGGSGDDKPDSCGGGGGSYNAGTDQQNTCCFKTSGHGYVTITLLFN